MVNYKFILFLLVFTLFFLDAKALKLPHGISNDVFLESVQTVKLHRDGWPLSNPIIELNSDQVLLLSFDDLTNSKSDYYYTIFHCTREWNVSNLPRQEYLPSFTDFPVDDYAFSINTKIGYINYQVRLPNENVPITLSGNYALVVFDRNEPDMPVLIRRFFVVENRVSIDARIRRSLFEQATGENQQVDIRVDHRGFAIQNPNSDVKLVIMQNGRDDNAVTNLQPVYMHNEELVYDYDNENVFVGGNEFRYFEIRGIKYPGEGIADLRYHAPLYHATLEDDGLRVNKRYNYYREMNGRYHVEAYTMQEPDIEADYLVVHFTLPMENVLMGGGVYVFGELSNWRCTSQNRMKWNPEYNRYELGLLLKQGYYNYMYAWMDDENGIIKTHALEGSHHDTENDYQVFLYYGKRSDRYDRLIGYQTFNSHINRVFKSN